MRVFPVDESEQQPRVKRGLTAQIRAIPVGKSRLVEGEQRYVSPVAYRVCGAGNFRVESAGDGLCRVWRVR
jgi:hypothetical protein